MPSPAKPRDFLLYAAIIVVSLLILFTRRPDAFTLPQFWAEDGRQWYQQAYNDGAIRSIFKPESGYFQTSSRLVAAVAQLFPLSLGPAVFNSAAIGVKLAVVLFLFSGRLARLLPDRTAQAFAALIYLAMPHSYEVHANLTNAIWHLALLACLILLAAPAAGRAGRVLDGAVVALSAVSGPFGIFLAPLAAWKAWRERDPAPRSHARVLLAILTAGAAVQLISILLTPRGARAPLGATGEMFFKILGGHWFVNAIFGEVGLSWLIRNRAWDMPLSLLVTAAGLGLLAYAFIKSNDELRLLIGFAALVVAASMASPLVAVDVPQWAMMAFPAIGGRYWLIPIFCFFLSLFWIARHAPRKWLRAVAAALLIASLAGVVFDWRYRPYKDLAFAQHAAAFEKAETGQTVVIPINPDWDMTLRKK